MFLCVVPAASLMRKHLLSFRTCGEKTYILSAHDVTRSFCRLSGRPLYVCLERGRACAKVALEDLHVGVGLVVAQLGHELGGLPVGDARVV
jgi:hypothetical protein